MDCLGFDSLRQSCFVLFFISPKYLLGSRWGECICGALEEFDCQITIEQVIHVVLYYSQAAIISISGGAYEHCTLTYSHSHTPHPAAGLYYLAELIEEYSVLAKKILTYLLIVSCSLASQSLPSLPFPYDEVWEQVWACQCVCDWSLVC